MNLEIGMYVRTDTGQIAKSHGDFYEPSVDIGVGIIEEVNGIWIDDKCIGYIDKKYIKKASYNIIDLIEEGDYVNGYKVLEVCIGNFELDNPLNVKALKLEFIQEDFNPNIPFFKRYTFVTNNDIKSIVTKEQFEKMSYKV